MDGSGVGLVDGREDGLVVGEAVLGLTDGSKVSSLSGSDLPIQNSNVSCNPKAPPLCISNPSTRIL
jgi:hypothetical protein